MVFNSDRSRRRISCKANGTQVENFTSVPEVSASITRTKMTNKFKRSTASVYRYEGIHDQGNSNFMPPGGAMQPWNGSTLEWECCMVSSTRLWASEAAILGGRHRIALTLNQNLRSRVLQMGQTREALIGGAYNKRLSLSSIVLNVCHMCPDF